ncbi:vegetative cell wall protein gp1-like [Forsythia ovata]|uniref:Vegetative cell wall protein gp1-like n=1 Tax=Forsythia ovata TaxID=205694 RepID=A0ABD1WWI9_9LAMI
MPPTVSTVAPLSAPVSLPRSVSTTAPVSPPIVPIAAPLSTLVSLPPTFSTHTPVFAPVSHLLTVSTQAPLPVPISFSPSLQPVVFPPTAVLIYSPIPTPEVVPPQIESFLPAPVPSKKYNVPSPSLFFFTTHPYSVQCSGSKQE